MTIWASDLFDRKRRIGSELHTILYISEEKNKVIFSPVAGAGGLYYEQENPIVTPFDIPVEELANRAKESLLAFEKKPKELRDLNFTNWHAYNASKAKSKKAFRSQYVHIWLQTIKGNLRIEGSTVEKDQIFVSAYIAPGVDDHDLGALLLRVYRCCRWVNQMPVIL